MKNTLFCLMGLLASSLLCAQNSPMNSLYGTGNWDADSLGNHRVVVAIDKQCDAVVADMQWRRRDYNPEKKDLYIIDAASGKRITNVFRHSINRERGVIVFQPKTVPGKYYIYYLKTYNTGSANYPNDIYPEFKETASSEWLKKNRLATNRQISCPKAKIIQYQAINKLNSFYPMEIIATSKEKKQFTKRHQKEDYVLFPEDRKFPIRMTNDLPFLWMNLSHSTSSFQGTAQKGEYYVWQLGLWAFKSQINQVKVSFTDLKDARTGETIPASSFTCFNTEGTDVKGRVFDKSCDVPKNKVQALWIGTQVPEQLQAGIYKGNIVVSSSNAETKSIALTLTVEDRIISNHGDNEPWRHSRLRWLNSQIGFDDEVVAPYTPLALKGHTIHFLGREVKLTATGFPAQINSYFNQEMTGMNTHPNSLLTKPMDLVAGSKWKNLDFTFTKRKRGTIAWKALNKNNRFVMEMEGQIEADGCLEYKITLVALSDGAIDNVELQTSLQKGIAKYMMGLGRKGGFCPETFHWKWDVEKNQDAVWIGDVNGGLQLRLYDNHYERPLNTNFYHKKPLIMPIAWENNGKGGISLKKSENGPILSAYSGEQTLQEGDKLVYDFTLLVTPFRTINTNKHWHNRYYHAYDFIDKIKKYGGNVVNVHHGTAINPFINYPYLRSQEMKAYIDGAHALDMKVKIYDTVRELSNSCAELFALRSLGDEIFSKGNGGGYSWLQEHLDPNYIAAWYVPEMKDAAIVNSAISRWHNYYLEGLDWLVKNVGIDGLYIDDLAFDRSTMKRIRKILSRTNPGALIDLHSANQFNPKDGYANSANLYMEHFPYLDRLWFGEYFDYDMPPEFWLTEISGIPYGLMGEMLWKGGNRWRGMLYGMTARSPWSGDNTAIWNFWNEFGMKDSHMIGYWVTKNPVKTASNKTLATVYIHPKEKTLIALATWEDHDAKVKLTIDCKRLGLDPAHVRLHAPAIEDYQTEQYWKLGDTITVPQGKGLLIVIE